jgi:7-carboxy-7-deazaguanine synthase
MPYHIKEMFFTLQGEGVQAGRAAVFCRFAGCNLWTGRESDRASAVCSFCDTEFVGTDGIGGGTFESAADVARTITLLWPRHTEGTPPFVVCTGGEPLLQVDKALIDAFREAGMKVAIETNGTLPAPDGLDWICVSPKGNTRLILTAGDELKLVFPQKDAHPGSYENLDFKHFLLQPMDGELLEENTRLAKEYCLAHPRWRLSLQIHKILGLP